MKLNGFLKLFIMIYTMITGFFFNFACVLMVCGQELTDGLAWVLFFGAVGAELLYLAWTVRVVKNGGNADG
jgi:hypothetical protein